MRKANRVFAGAAAVLMLALMAAGVHAQTPTDFSGPVAVQPQEPPVAALQIDRVGNQDSAVDIYGHGGPEMRFFARDPFKGQVLRTYINNSGAFTTNAWMVISGALSDYSSPTPSVLYPTSDSFMLGIWSDVPGPALVIHPTKVSHPDAPLATMDGYGNYRFAVLPDGGLAFSGSDSNTYNQTDFDTILHRIGPGELRAEAEFSATAIANTPSLASLLNDSSATVAPGTVVKISPARDLAFLPTATQDDAAVAGVAYASIEPGATGPILIHGVGQVMVVGAVLRGSLLVSANSAGAARSLLAGETPPPGAIIGKALTASSSASGIVTALINP